MSTYTAYPDHDNACMTSPRPITVGEEGPVGCFGMSIVECKIGANTLPSVSPGAAGARLDRWLADVCPSLSRSRLKALLISGCVRVDDVAVTDPARRIKSGQVMSIYVPEPLEDTPSPQEIPLDIRFEDQHVIVINKPAGLVVHPAAGHHDGTLVNALLHHCRGELSGIGGVCRPGIVHRLDKDTSGLIVVAKTDQAHQHLAKQFSDHTTKRVYYALVRGVPYPRTGEVVGNIGRSSHSRQKMSVQQRGGKHAVTHYRVLKSLSRGRFSLVECRLSTGRTHQVRVHMAHLGHALVGDPLYGASVRWKKMALAPEIEHVMRSFRRQALHAYQLGFLHPTSEAEILLQADPPEDINVLFAALGEDGCPIKNF